MEDKTLTTAFLISRLIQQANTKDHGPSPYSTQHFSSGLRGATSVTTGNALILTHDFYAFEKVHTPFGYLVAYDSAYTRTLSQADQEIKDKCGLIKITPHYQTSYGSYGAQYLVSHFKHGDVEYHADPELIEKAKASKFAHLDKLDCTDLNNKVTRQEMAEFDKCFHQQKFLSNKDFDNREQVWTQHLLIWFNKGYINDKGQLADKVRGQVNTSLTDTFKTIFNNHQQVDIQF